MKNANVKFGTFYLQVYMCIQTHAYIQDNMHACIISDIEKSVKDTADFIILKLIKVINSFIISLFKNAKYFKHSKTKIDHLHAHHSNLLETDILHFCLLIFLSNFSPKI